MYGLISDIFKPNDPIVPPPATLRVYMTVSMDTWGILGRDNLNEMAYYPDPDYVPLLVGMYNDEITIDETTISKAAENIGFSNQAGAYVVDKTTVLEIVIKNQVGTDGFSVPHPVPHRISSAADVFSSICTVEISGIWVVEWGNSRNKHSKNIWPQ
jgi:hypothetical protein